MKKERTFSKKTHSAIRHNTNPVSCSSSKSEKLGTMSDHKESWDRLKGLYEGQQTWRTKSAKFKTAIIVSETQLTFTSTEFPKTLKHKVQSVYLLQSG